MRIKLPLLITLLLIVMTMSAQNVGIGTTTPNASAQLDISSTARGLLIPRMDTNAIKAIPSPAKGLMVYDSARNQLLVNMGTATAPNWQNIIVGSGWALTGNAGTNGTAVLGNTDNTPIVLYSKNEPVAVLDADTLHQNISLGVGALTSVGSSVECVAIGLNSMHNGNCQNCVAIGTGNMPNTIGNNNIAIGQSNLDQNTNGVENIAIGDNNLHQNTSDHNVAVGFGALLGNTTGNYNIAFGANPMTSNSTGVGNIGIGYAALFETSQSNFNTVIGHNSAVKFDLGYNNVFIGANNDVFGDGFFNDIAIGQAVTCTGSDQARIGNSSTNSIGGFADWTNFSDGRYKKNMRENVKGLDFILKLRPITYNLDITGIEQHLSNGKGRPMDKITQQSRRERESAVFSGFSAQEVEQAAASAGYDFSGIDKPKNANDFYGLRYGDFVVPLVKAVQEQQQLIEALQKKIGEQDQLLKQLLNRQK